MARNPFPKLRGLRGIHFLIRRGRGSGGKSRRRTGGYEGVAARGRPRSSRRPYGKEGVSNDHRWPTAVTTGDRRVRGPVLTFGREKELRIGFIGQPFTCPGLIKKLVK